MTKAQRIALVWVRDHADTFYHYPAKKSVDYPRSDVIWRLYRDGLVIRQSNARHCLNDEREERQLGWNLTPAGTAALQKVTL